MNTYLVTSYLFTGDKVFVQNLPGKVPGTYVYHKAVLICSDLGARNSARLSL